MLNLQSHIAFLGIVLLVCSVFATAGSSIAISYTQIDNSGNIAPLMPSSYSSTDFNNNSNSNSNNNLQITSTIKTSPNVDNQQHQLQQKLNVSPDPLSIKITSHTQNQTVPANKPLRISGISSDGANSNCLVYADWNDLKPMLKANASGPNGINDYSNWTFTYTRKYHLITEGTNELTSKLDCGGSSVKYFTVNVTGVSELLPLLSSPTNENNNNSGNSLPLPISPTANTDTDRDRDRDNNDDDNDNDVGEVSSNNNKGSGSGDSDSNSESDNQESRNIDKKEDKEKGQDKKEKKNASKDESKKDKGPKSKNK